ncbi:NTP transferase domain-containing protein [Sediminibacillus dalangtanensis]|uniref:NTP transferase domain-containing protein n=1 Tax=Sediminibacillus dalangtanensis TaxID=2729421 RepID=A0ABX7VXM3_9BACI|nr:glycosyltransferase family protein [Sediminibacillus dalangtanensis]QTN00386.1 NTP transferase domain-containing protein [Sediminibacillus dalangtanensis]
MKIIAIIQARMGSTRLPGKVMKEVLNKTLLEYEIKQVKSAALIDEVIVATTKNRSDDRIVDLCKKLSIPTFRGAEQDVLSRYYEAATEYKGDIIVRLTADCPLIDPAVIDKVILEYLKHKKNYDYVSNTIVRTYPRGMDTGVLSYRTLKEINAYATSESDREHVTSYLYRVPGKYRTFAVTNEEDLSNYRLTVDTKEDFEVVANILENLYKPNSSLKMNDIVTYLKQHPSLLTINQNIEQKRI